MSSATKIRYSKIFQIEIFSTKYSRSTVAVFPLKYGFIVQVHVGNMIIIVHVH